MSVVTDPPRRSGVFARTIGAVFSLSLGTLFCLTPATALIVLGWLMRRMRMVALRTSGLNAAAPGWVMGASGTGVVTRLLGSLASNIREGVMAAAALALATAPFSVIWILSWWAGWENSFSKGYEQSFAGPALGLGGVALFSVIMIWLPMALAHQAVENRAFAVFEFRLVRNAVRHSGWGYLMLALATVLASLPLFAGRGLVVFASNIIPGFEEMTPDALEGLQGGIALGLAAYTFLALLVLRGWAARLYAQAVARALEGPNANLWASSTLANGIVGGQRAWKLTHWVRLVLLSVIWFGMSAQIFIAQFLNHDWHIWLTHPLIFLPWPG